MLERLEAQHRRDSELYPSVILFHDVVHVLAGPDLHRMGPAEVELIPHAHAPQGRMALLEAIGVIERGWPCRFSARRKKV